MTVPLIFWHDDVQGALKAARKAGRQKGCSFQELGPGEGPGYVVLDGGSPVERHLVRH